MGNSIRIFLASPVQDLGLVYKEVFLNLRRILDRTKLISRNRERSIVIIRNFELGRLAKLSTKKNIPQTPFLEIPNEVFDCSPDLGFISIKNDYINLENSIIEILETNLNRFNIDYDYSISSIPSGLLNKYKTAIFPCFDFINPKLEANLIKFIEMGGNLVFGPTIPYLSHEMQSHSSRLQIPEVHEEINGIKSWKLKQGTIFYVSEMDKFNQIVNYLEDCMIINGPLIKSSEVEITTFSTESDGNRLFFIANNTEISKAVTVSNSKKLHLRGIYKSCINDNSSLLQIQMEPYSIVILEEFSNDS
nr:hypothetical protein [uncultured Sphaerochaeta sp.]